MTSPKLLARMSIKRELTRHCVNSRAPEKGDDDPSKELFRRRREREMKNWG